MFTARFTEVQGPDGRVPAELLRVSHDIGTWDELVVLPPPPPPRKADASDEPFVMPKLDVLAMADMVAAVMLVQRVYRQFKASFTLRKKAAWKIYQEIEYRTERKETGMSDFLTRLQEHLPQMVEEAAETEVRAANVAANVAPSIPSSLSFVEVGALGVGQVVRHRAAAAAVSGDAALAVRPAQALELMRSGAAGVARPRRAPPDPPGTGVVSLRPHNHMTRTKTTAATGRKPVRREDCKGVAAQHEDRRRIRRTAPARHHLAGVDALAAELLS